MFSVTKKLWHVYCNTESVKCVLLNRKCDRYVLKYREWNAERETQIVKHRNCATWILWRGQCNTLSYFFLTSSPFSSCARQCLSVSARLDWLLWLMVIWPLNNNREHLIRKLLIPAPIWFVIVSRVMSASRCDINRPKCDGKKMVRRVLQPEGTEGSVLIETVNRGYPQFNQNLPNLAKMTNPPPPKKKKGGVKVWPISHLHRPTRSLALTATRMEINYRIVLIIDP